MIGMPVRVITKILFSLLCITLFNSIAFADDKDEKKSGINWEFSYIADGWYGLSGGLRHQADHLGKADLSIDFDLEKLFYWRGMTALLSVQNIHGGKPNLKVNSLQGFDNIEFDPKNNMTYLSQLWIQKQFNDIWSVLFGYYDTNTEFYVTESSALLIQSTYGMGTSLAQIPPRGPSTFPIDGISLRIKYTPSVHNYFQFVTLDASLGNPLNPAFSHRPFSTGAGLLNIAELGHIFLEKVEKGSAGKIAVGAWGVTTKAEKVNEDPPGTAYNMGMYFLFDYPIYVDPKNCGKTVNAFFRYGNATPSVNLFDHSIGTGLLFTGLFNREDDALSLGVAPAWTSSASRDADPAIPKMEFQTELTYAAVVNQWLTVQPDVQYIIFQGGDRTVFKNDVLAGLRLILTIS